MKKLTILLLLLVSVFTLSSCGKEETFYTNISNEVLIEMLDGDTEYYFIDVRTLEEYNDKKISGFNYLMDLYIIEKNDTMVENLDNTIPVVLMCNSGNRSVEAADIFREAGFTEIYNLTDGIQGWMQDDYETE